MNAEWQSLRRAMARCRAQRLTVPLWWRDDDAVNPTTALDRLEALSEKLQLPVHIAVIPGHASTALAARTAESDQLIPLVHGWVHGNHAPPDSKKAEFGTHTEARVAEIHRGNARMQALFGRGYLPVFVPPWNRMNDKFCKDLVDAGFRGVSGFTPRSSRCTPEGLVRINAHIDPVDWRGTRDLKDAGLLLTQATENIEARLRGESDASEPLGYLTHHLVHTPDIWEFSRRFLTELLEAGACVQPLDPLLECP
jgi:hypothetical protein